MTPKSFRILFIIGAGSVEADVRQKVSEIRGRAFEFTTAPTFREAFARLQRETFDVLFADLTVPDCEGLASLRRLILAATDAPVVIVSNSDTEGEALEAVRAGAEDYTIAARMNAAAFERVIFYAIERHRARQRTSLQFFVSRMLAESSTIQEAANTILGVLCEFVRCERGEVWQSDRRQSQLSLVESWISSAGSLASKNAWPEKKVLGRGEGLIGRAWECGAQEWDHDSATVAIALSVGTGSLGVLALEGPGVLNRDDDVVKLLASVCDQLGQFMARKLAEDERENIASERLLVLDSTSEGIYGVDRDDRVTFMNKSAARILNCVPDDVRGKNSHALLHHTRADGKPYPESECPIFQVMRGGPAFRNDQEYFWRPDGSHFAADYSAKAIYKDGFITGAVVSFSDISAKRLMEVELRHAQKLEAVGRLAAGIAHEINTPIQFIGDNTRFMQGAFRDTLQLIEKYEQVYEESKTHAASSDLVVGISRLREKIEWDYLRSEIPSAMEHALDGVHRVATIVRAMKEFAHVDRRAERTAADLNKAIESTLVVARNEAKYIAEVETEFGALPPVICHLGDLNQVFLNLFVNAVHAIAEANPGNNSKGLITVRTTCEDDCVVVAIRDTGSGIPEAIRGKVFDPFFTTKEVGKGTGQGLALARTIVVERHGGTLTFETEVGKGTTFYVRLPVRGVPEVQEVVSA